MYGELVIDSGDSNDQNTVPSDWRPLPKTYKSPSKKTERQGSTDEMLDGTKSDNEASAKGALSDDEMESASEMETSSENDDHSTYDDSKFDLGYRFKKKFTGKSGEQETLVGEVTEVLTEERARIVSYHDGNEANEKLHVDDIIDCESVPRFEHSLRTGDKIEFKSYFGKEMTGTVIEIGDSAFTTDTLPMVSTDIGEQLIEKGNEKFRLLDSEYEDAPPRGQWTDISSVNLVRGIMPPLERQERLKNPGERAVEVIQNTPGGNVVLLESAMSQAMRKPLPENLTNARESDVANSPGSHKYEVGTKVKKKFKNKWFDGVVTLRGYEGRVLTYEIHYPEDNDLERITEEKMEDIVVPHRRSL